MDLLAVAVAKYHILEVARVIREQRIDLLRCAANASAAGPDWFRVDAPLTNLGWRRRGSIRVTVGDAVVDSPRALHVDLHPRRVMSRFLHSQPQHVQLRMTSSGVGRRTATHLSLYDMRQRRWRTAPIARKRQARAFLDAVVHLIALEVSLTTSAEH
jgi:hypothetical protein